MSDGRRPGSGDPPIGDLRALAKIATDKVALYRRRLYLGRGEPRELAELERVAAGARDRLKRALARSRDG